MSSIIFGIAVCFLICGYFAYKDKSKNFSIIAISFNYLFIITNFGAITSTVLAIGISFYLQVIWLKYCFQDLYDLMRENWSIIVNCNSFRHHNDLVQIVLKINFLSLRRHS
jgi:hypothetical protein